jgi:excinuclease ABC subunit C
MPIESIVSAIASLPACPGVYRMINAAGKDLYIGKAKDLQKRVSSYTRLANLPHRLKQMVSQVACVGIVTTATEIEALLLEAQLIKRYRPPYNILLKNSNPLAYLALSNHVFPRVQMQKNPDQTGSLWKIGPFLSRTPLQVMTDLVYKRFLLRSCTDVIFAQRNRPCLQYHIQRCSAPCVGKISASDYNNQVLAAKNFLKGDIQKAQKELKEEMHIFVRNHAYDQAAGVRDQLQAVDQLALGQIGGAAGKGDVIGWAVHSGGACIHIVSWRDGATYGCETFFFENASPKDGPYILSCFLRQFYSQNPPPSRLILPFLADEIDDFSLMMRHHFQKIPHCIVPKRGPLLALLNQAHQQAYDALLHHGHSQASHSALMDQGAKVFSWQSIPSRIEIYDNSHHQGTSAVAVMVVHDGQDWDKKSYRTWSMVSNDDCHMMQQVMTRRFSNAAIPLPDFIIIDGGRGQLSAVRSVLRDLGRGALPLIAIAKTMPHDTVFLADGTPLNLPPHHPVLHWVQRLRDEAHRFAVQTHRQKHRNQMTKSPIQALPGMGKKRHQALMNHFGTLDALKSASLETLSRIVPRAVAATLFTYFKKIDHSHRQLQ